MLRTGRHGGGWASATFAIVVGCGGGGPDDPLADLRALGADTDIPSSPTGPDGNPLPNGYHPLRKRYTVLDPHAEIYFGGYTVDGHREGLFDDGHAGDGDANDTAYASRLTPSDESWASVPYKAAIGADVDGDGIQEIVVVYHTGAPTNELRVKVIHGPRDGNPATESVIMPLLTDVTAPAIPPRWIQHSLAAANVDDDPADELFVAFGRLYVFDDPAHDFRTLPLDVGPYDSTRISIATGDFDAAPGDQTDEVVVAYADPAIVYIDAFDGLERILHKDTAMVFNDAPRSTNSFNEAFVATGNLDGDPGDEIALYGHRREYDEWELLLTDDASSGFAWFASFRYLVPADLGGWAGVGTIETVDLDGDHIDEILVDHLVLDGLEGLPGSESTATVTDLQHPDVVDVIDARLGTGCFDIGIMCIFYPVAADVAAVGNVSAIGSVAGRERAEEIVAIDHWANRLAVGGLDSNGVFAWSTIRTGSGPGADDVVAVANVDRDSRIVRFDDQHELLYSDPEVIVAMSAPPFYSPDEQNVAASSTTFGRSTVVGMETIESVGYAVGWSIGYSAEDPFGIVSASIKTSFEQKFDRFARTTFERWETISYTTGPEDSVVFTIVPFDVYYYTIVSSPHPEEVNTPLSVNMPRAQQTLLASAAFFDEHVTPEDAVSPFFQHEVGEPRSYPTLAERDTLCGASCFRSSSAVAVGQGGGFTTIEISQGMGMGTGTAYDYSVRVESQVGVAGVTAGVSAGFNYGFQISTSTHEWTIFTGRIGSLTNLTPENAYSAGLFAYRAPFGTREVLAVDYWVE